MQNRCFSKKLRLLRASEFERVFQQRCSAADGAVVVYGAMNDLGYARLGLTVSRKVGHAVVRNRWKRALREAFRLTQGELPSLDLICIPRPPAQANVQQLIVALPKLAARIERKLGRTSPGPTLEEPRTEGAS